MDAYVYQAALWCEACAGERCAALEYVNIVMGGKWPLPGWQDSTCYPQGPYPDGGGEADTPQHCNGCSLFLENPLTGDGTRYVIEQLVEHARDGSGNKDVLAQWAEHYNAQLYEPGSVTLEALQFEYSMEDDEWGACMGWWFSIAAELYTRGEDLPEEWKYSPGAAGKPVDPDDYHAPMIAGASAKTLFEFVKTVEEDSKRLKNKGKDY